MNAAFWIVIETAGFVTAGILFILGAILFYKLRIYTLIDELSERQRKKELAHIRERRGTVRSGRDRRQSRRADYLKKREQEKIEQLEAENRTAKLVDGEEKTMKLPGATSVLYDTNNTRVLTADKHFCIVREVLQINTEERIIDREENQNEKQSTF